MKVYTYSRYNMNIKKTTFQAIKQSVSEALAGCMESEPLLV